MLLELASLASGGIWVSSLNHVAGQIVWTSPRWYTYSKAGNDEGKWPTFPWIRGKGPGRVCAMNMHHFYHMGLIQLWKCHPNGSYLFTCSSRDFRDGGSKANIERRIIKMLSNKVHFGVRLRQIGYQLCFKNYNFFLGHLYLKISIFYLPKKSFLHWQGPSRIWNVQLLYIFRPIF